MASYLESIDSQLSQGVNPTDANNAAIAQTAAVANPDGNTITTPQSPQPTNVINEVNPGQITPLPKEVVPLAETKDTTNTDIASTNVIGAAENQANLAASEKTSQLDLTQELNAIDVNQANTKIANANANIAELTAIEKKQQLDKEANELKYQEDLRKNQEEEIASLKVQQASELVKNDAEAAELKSKQDKAERDAETANEVALMQSNVAFAKLGGSFSGAAINTAQKLFTDGAYNIASLKSSNAYNYASLKVKINTVAFEHTQAIGKLIQETAEKEFASKERLREFIGSSQKNILLGKKEAQAAIQDAITTYKNEKQTREDKLYSDMNSANSRLQSATETIQKQVTAEETTAKAKIDMYLNNGQWASLAPETKVELEKAAGIPVNTSAQTATVRITQGINSRLKEVVGSVVSIPEVMMKKMHNEIQSFMKLGYPMPTAIQMVTDKYKNQIPQVASAKIAADTKAKLENAKTQAEIDKLASEAKQNLSEIEIAKAKLALAKRASSGASSGKIASFVTADGLPLKEKDGALYKLDGTIYGNKAGESIKNKESIVDYEAKAAADINALKNLGGGNDGLVDTSTTNEESDIPWVPFI